MDETQNLLLKRLKSCVSEKIDTRLLSFWIKNKFEFFRVQSNFLDYLILYFLYITRDR